MVCFRFTLGLGLVLGGGLLASAQSFNLDLDVGSGPPESGNGAPSSAFGGAAGQTGVWQALYAGGPTLPVNLVGLDGQTTSAQLVATGGIGSYGGFNFPGNTGDYRKLMNDEADLLGANHEIDYHFSGFQPGTYMIYVYAVSSSGGVFDVAVNVPGATSPIQHVTGPMSANQFQVGITHTIHTLVLSGSSFEIDVHTVSNVNGGQCEGFQIAAVPEPTTLLTCCAGLAALGLSRRGI